MPAVGKETIKKIHGVAAEAVPQHGASRETFGFQNPQGVFCRVARMDDHRAIRFLGEGELDAEGFLLDEGRAVLPVKIEADFTDGPQPGIFGKGFAHGLEGGSGTLLPVAGMDAHQEEDARIAGERTLVGVVCGGAEEDLPDGGKARAPGPSHNLGEPFDDPLGVEVGMGVGPCGGKAERFGKRTRRIFFLAHGKSPLRAFFLGLAAIYRVKARGDYGLLPSRCTGKRLLRPWLQRGKAGQGLS